jgi:Fur family ferric uptake transcriptional regulator
MLALRWQKQNKQKSSCKEAAMSAEQLEQKQIIINRLKEDGCRITKQRLMLLDIILEDECSSCKEIYYRATKKDPTIGTATVYRMINTLEEIGAISRKNMYKVSV